MVSWVDWAVARDWRESGSVGGFSWAAPAWSVDGEVVEGSLGADLEMGRSAEVVRGLERRVEDRSRRREVNDWTMSNTRQHCSYINSTPGISYPQSVPYLQTMSRRRGIEKVYTYSRRVCAECRRRVQRELLRSSKMGEEMRWRLP